MPHSCPSEVSVHEINFSAPAQPQAEATGVLLIHALSIMLAGYVGTRQLPCLPASPVLQVSMSTHPASLSQEAGGTSHSL